ncbi:hypothetical protein FRB97_001123 [Tulasnella sp. 331]|nr:hypothetical protein FRB97_001123 [Tulasnella sp. 331]
MRHSTVFRDMLGISLPVQDGDESFDGIAVIALDDDVEDLQVLFRLTYDCPPLDVPFELIDRTLRITQKYDCPKFHSWALTYLMKYPSTKTPMEKLLKDPIWKTSYANPTFCIRFIGVTEYLDRRDLDSHTALAYYALSVVDWGIHDQVRALSTLPPATIHRLLKGKATIQSACALQMVALSQHKCPPQTTGPSSSFGARSPPVNHFLGVPVNTGAGSGRPSWEACVVKRDVALQSLLPHLNGDFITALDLSTPTIFLEQNGACESLKSFIERLGQDIYDRIPGAFNIRTGPL